MPSASQPRLSQEERAIPAPVQSTITHEEGSGSFPKPAQLPGFSKAKAAGGARGALASATADGSGQHEQEQRGLRGTPEAEMAALREAGQARALGEADVSQETAQATSQAAAPAGALGKALTPQRGALRPETRPGSKMSDRGQQAAAPAPDAIQDVDAAGAGGAQASATGSAQAISSPLAVVEVSQTAAESAGFQAAGHSAASAESGATGASWRAGESAAPKGPQQDAGAASAVKGPVATGEGSQQLSQVQWAHPDLPSEQGQHPITPATGSHHTSNLEAVKQPGSSAEAAGPSSDRPSSADCTSTPFAAAAQASQPVSGSNASTLAQVSPIAWPHCMHRSM